MKILGVKKALFVLLFFVTTSCFCRGDDKPIDIIGEWKFVKMTVKVKASDSKTEKIITDYINNYYIPNNSEELNLHFSTDSIVHLSRNEGSDNAKFSISGNLLIIKDEKTDEVYNERIEQNQGKDSLCIIQNTLDMIDTSEARDALDINPSAKIERLDIIRHFVRMKTEHK